MSGRRVVRRCCILAGENRRNVRFLREHLSAGGSGGDQPLIGPQPPTRLAAASNSATWLRGSTGRAARSCSRPGGTDARKLRHCHAATQRSGRRRRDYSLPNCPISRMPGNYLICSDRPTAKRHSTFCKSPPVCADLSSVVGYRLGCRTGRRKTKLAGQGHGL
jgi:hypothetical protein